MIRTLLPCLLVLLALGPAACLPQGPPAVITGELEGDQVWSGVVHLSGDVVVPAGNSLEIRPGTRVLFTRPVAGSDTLRDHPHFPGSELIVRGAIVAEGTPGRPVVFAAADPRAEAGSWGGINLAGSPHASFSHCIFRQADSAVHSQESEVYIEQSLFEGNRVGIRFHSSAILVENNLLRRNGTAIRFHFGAPVICRNRLVDNDKGFFLTSHPRDYLIEANDIVGSREFAVVLGEEVPLDVTMPGNYWGESDPAKIRDGFFDRSRVPYLGRVLVAPVRTRPVAGAGPSWIR